MRQRFQRTLSLSIGLHILLFAWLLINRTNPAPMERVIDITWFTQELPPLIKIVPQPAEEIAPQPNPVKPVLTVKQKLAQQTQASDAVRAERLQEQLRALGASQVADKAMSVLNTTSTSLLNTARSTMAPTVDSGPVANLNRGGGEHRPAVALVRGPISSSHASPIAADAPTGGAAKTAATPGENSTAVRDLGGASLAGPVADRQVIEFSMPDYPAWATRQAVEATVTLYFLVLPSGRVKENVQVQKTAGFQDFDNNATAALKAWRFAPLAGSDAREQWGTITFRYQLKD